MQSKSTSISDSLPPLLDNCCLLPAMAVLLPREAACNAKRLDSENLCFISLPAFLSSAFSYHVRNLLAGVLSLDDLLDHLAHVALWASGNAPSLRQAKDYAHGKCQLDESRIAQCSTECGHRSRAVLNFCHEHCSPIAPVCTFVVSSMRGAVVCPVETASGIGRTTVPM